VRACSYGYITNTKVKLVVVLQDCSQDVNMKSWLRDLHTLYLATVCNPFSDMHSAIQNPTFEQNIHKLVKNWSQHSTAQCSTHIQAQHTAGAAGAGAVGLHRLSVMVLLTHSRSTMCVARCRFYVERK